MTTNNHWIDRSVSIRLLLAVSCLGMVGCGPQFGAMGYFLGVGSNEKVAAQYTLPEGPLIILVDDEQDLVQPATAKHALVDELATLLKENEAADRVTTNEEIARLRQTQAKFDDLSIREIGRLAKADTMIWVNVQEYSVNDDLELVVTSGKFAARVKVFSINEEDRNRIRLWPPDRAGHFVKAEVDPHELRSSKTKDELREKVGQALAAEIAPLFYETKLEK